MNTQTLLPAHLTRGPDVHQQIGHAVIRLRAKDALRPHL
jgi:hypothetical protein